MLQDLAAKLLLSTFSPNYHSNLTADELTVFVTGKDSFVFLQQKFQFGVAQGIAGS